jgi:enoyl-CoA hydratase
MGSGTLLGPWPASRREDRWRKPRSSDLIYDKPSGIAYLTLNRPERRNAFSPQMMLLAEAWHDVCDRDDVRVAILTGTGSESFCAGGDLELLIPLITGARKPAD